MSASLLHIFPSAWRFALVGVLVSLPVTVLLKWLPDSDANVAVGAFAAGLTAAIRSRHPDEAGVRAGLLGGVVAVLTPIGATVSSVIESAGIP